MALTEIQQIAELVKQSRSILIIFKKDWTSDVLSGSLALSRALKKINKQTNIVCQDFEAPNNLSFLGLTEVDGQINTLQKFVVSIDTSQTQVGEFYYDNNHDKLNIYLSPKNGKFKPEDVSASIANYEFV